MLASSEQHEMFSNTLTLWKDLLAEEEWPLLRGLAERHVNSSDPAVATQAKRMLALVHAKSDDPVDKAMAIQYYQSLARSESAEFMDIGNLTILLVESGCIDDAVTAVVDGINTFPAKASYFFDIGQKIVETTGNKDIRKQIENAIRKGT